MSEKRPMLLVFAGPNGSGNSTITQYFDKIGTYTNADEMVASTQMSNEDAAKIRSPIRFNSSDELFPTLTPPFRPKTNFTVLQAKYSFYTRTNGK